jgi:fibronectin type 3 domain-containing protein
VVGLGGVFAYGASLKFPATVWNRSNYWVDVVFRQDTASAHTVGLSWVASVTPAVTGYRIYRGTVKGGPYSLVGNVGTSTVYTDSARLASGATYYYVVTAVDTQGTESSYSNEASAVIPR